MEKNKRYHHEILRIDRKIKYYQEMIALSTNIYQKMLYENLLYSEINQLNYWQWYYQQEKDQSNQIDTSNVSNQKEFTIKELTKYDGSSGRPAYVAVNGIVYDVSLEAT